MKTKMALLYITVLLARPASDVSGFYNASAGRWLSRDPIEDAGFESQRISPKQRNSSRVRIENGTDIYVMAANDCVSHIDYLGLENYDYKNLCPLFSDDLANNGVFHVGPGKLG